MRWQGSCTDIPRIVTGPYIVDFACLEAGLVVEADGGQHLVNVRNDRVRTEYPESSGYRVMRFWNHDILRDTQVVMGCIHRFLIELPDSE